MTVVEQIGSDRVHVEPVEVELRRFPYPYKAMLAICSDLDETSSLQAYLETMRFLNSAGTTPLGPGAALEVGNSMYFDMPSGRFSYWRATMQSIPSLPCLVWTG